MGASAARDSDSALAELDAEIPHRMVRALSGLATVSYATATQRFALRGGRHPSSSIPPGVLDDATGQGGSPLRERSLFDFFAHQWRRAGDSSFRRRLVCYQAEVALDQARRGPMVRPTPSALMFERELLKHVGVDALEVAVRLDVAVRFVRMLRGEAGRDPQWGDRLPAETR